MEVITSQAEATLTRRDRILAYLAERPDRTVYEICADLGYLRRTGKGATGAVLQLLRRMQQQALVVSRTEFRPRQGREVYLWRVAPPGTVPPRRLVSRAADERRRERDRASKRRARARARGLDLVPIPAIAATPAPRLTVPAAWSLPPGAACAGADPALFFPEPGASDQRAKEICAACPVRAECLAAALVNGERYGVWGGVNLETSDALSQAQEAGR